MASRFTAKKSCDGCRCVRSAARCGAGRLVLSFRVGATAPAGGRSRAFFERARGRAAARDGVEKLAVPAELYAVCGRTGAQRLCRWRARAGRAIFADHGAAAAPARRIARAVRACFAASRARAARCWRACPIRKAQGRAKPICPSWPAPCSIFPSTNAGSSGPRLRAPISISRCATNGRPWMRRAR